MDVEAIALRGQHYDMLEIASAHRWPPRPGTKPIFGPDLRATYADYFGSDNVPPPSHLTDPYEADNWRDCFQAARLYKRLVEGEVR
jgi:hypothetical protein